MKAQNLIQLKDTIFFKDSPINENMTTLLFGRLVFDKSEKELPDKEEKIEERKKWLLQVINFKKDINKLLMGNKEDED